MKPIDIVKRVLVGLVAVIAVCMMVFTVVSVTTFNRADRNLFGYKAFIALSDSMKATDFEAGDLVLVKETDCSTLQAGDIIAYTSQNTSNYGEVVTHKIREVTTDANGNPGFITYGTTTDTNDETVVTYSNVLGKYQGRLAGLGTFFQFLKTVPGYICCILVPFMILIISEAVRSVRLFRKYKAEQLEELRAEREKVEAERLEAQRMMQELMQLKSQVGEGAAGYAAPAAPAPAYEPAFQPAPTYQPTYEPVTAPTPAPRKKRAAHFAPPKQ